MEPKNESNEKLVNLVSKNDGNRLKLPPMPPRREPRNPELIKILQQAVKQDTEFIVIPEIHTMEEYLSLALETQSGEKIPLAKYITRFLKHSGVFD